MTSYSRGARQPLFGITFAMLGLAALASSPFVCAQTMQMDQQMDHMGHGGMAMSPAPAASGESYKVGDLTVTAPWARATPGGAKIGGGYLTVTNNGSSADRLLGATVAFADHVEIHEMSMTDGVMKMREISGGIEIKPGQTVELKPGGFHMMFVDLKQPLKQGDSVKAALKFE